MALEDLQSLTETDLRLIKHSPQKKFERRTIFWATWHPLTFTPIWPWKTSKAWPKLIWGSLSIAHKKIWAAYHILSNMTPVNFHTCMALKDLQSLPESDLRLNKHSPQKKFEWRTIFWATWHSLTFTPIWPWKTSKAWPKLIWGSLSIAHKKNLSSVPYFEQHDTR